MSNPKIGRAAADRAAQRAANVDDSPDRPHEDLSPEETARREAEKQALLQRLGARRSAPAAEPTPTVGEAEQEHETLVEGPTSTEINALLGRLDAEHEAAMKSAGESYEAQRMALLAQRREAEDRESRRVDLEISEHLAVALTAVRAGNAAGTERDATDAERAVQAQQAEWRERVAPAIQKARETRRELLAFRREYGPTLDEVLGMKRTDLLAGLPLVGIATSRSLGLVTQLHRNAENARSLLDGSLRTIEDKAREIATLIDSPHRWSGGVNSHGVRNQETVREINQALYELAMPNEALPALNDMMKGVTGCLDGIRQLREQFAGRPEVTAVPEPMLRGGDLEDLKHPPRPAGDTGPTRAETSMDLFRDGRRTE